MTLASLESDPSWAHPADITKRLDKIASSAESWQSWLTTQSVNPVRVPIKGPTAGDLTGRWQDVVTWHEKWRAWAAKRPVTLESTRRGGRVAGSNEIISHLHVENAEDLWAVTGTTTTRLWLLAIYQQAGAEHTPLGQWVLANPRQVEKHKMQWPQLVASAEWLARHAGSGLFLRHLDIPHVDTKFVESHQAVLRSLVPIFNPSYWDDDQRKLAAACGLAEKPARIRGRSLDPNQPWPAPGWAEGHVRCDDLAKNPPPHRRVLIVENEMTFLALPELPDTWAMLGGGYQVGVAGNQPWLSDRRVGYWGDLDSHGFAILHRLRSHCPHAESLLMTSEVLQEHPTQWVVEPKPFAGELPTLTAAEHDVLASLADHTPGQHVRLEQERIRQDLVVAALTDWLRR